MKLPWLCFIFFWSVEYAIVAANPATPAGAGLSAKYPGDVGIEHDPHVLFAENFEAGNIEDVGKRWGEISNKRAKVMAFSRDAPPGSSGKRSLQITATPGRKYGRSSLHAISRRCGQSILALLCEVFDGRQLHPPFRHVGRLQSTN